MLKSTSEGAGTVGCGFRILFFFILFHPRYAISCASEDGRSLMGGSHVVHRGVVADSAMTWPTRQLLCYLEMVWGFFLV